MNPMFVGQPPPKNNGLAIASMICGILAIVPGCCCGLLGIPLSIVALVMGIVAIGQINGSQGQMGGKGMAIAGTVCGGVAVAMDVVAMVFNVGSEVMKSLHV